MNNEDYYGRGMSFPVQISGSGSIAEASGVDKVEKSIRVVLGTQYGERVMRPLFGCNLKSLAFAPNNAPTANLARYYVTEGLRRWEPRIDVLDVTVTNDNDNGVLRIEIRYRLKNTPDVQSMIYPFYLEQS